MKTRWRQGLAVAGLTMLTMPLTAHAALAELSWSGRFGIGSIVYDRDAIDSVSEDGRGSFADSIVRFRVEGIRLPYGSDGILLQGTSGSILSRDFVTPCNFLQNCESSSVTFLLGRSHANDPLNYRLTMSLPFGLDDIDLIPINANGTLPLRDGQHVSGIIRNEFNSPSGDFLAVGWASITHRLLSVASPVPEPATWALFGLGAGLLGVARRRMAPK